MTSITLCMIVKNEAHCIKETFDSVHQYINYYVIIDTGSTDNTKEVITTYFDALGIKGEIHDRPWKNFGWNRTEAFKYAKNKGDYVWVIDADDLVEGKFSLPDVMIHDSYALIYGNSVSDGHVYWRTQLFKNNLDWIYKGVLHEYPELATKQSDTNKRLEGEYCIRSRRLGDRNKIDPTAKALKDAATLIKGLKDEPDNDRYWFYLGQSYMDACEWEKAIEAYDKRISMQRWDEEVYFSLYRKAMAFTELDKWDKALETYLEAYNYRPTRAESLYKIAFHYRMNKQYTSGYLFAKLASEIDLPKDSLFVSQSVYNWQSLDERSVCASWIGKKQESYSIGSLLLKERRQYIPSDQLERIINNYNQNRGILENE